ncbi:MAG: hypothetical protein PHE77_01270 [Candidatus Pacebacteria bacterium]|nr:hypothetical protein [Candidatus Paceibacterota bacterium]
MEKKRLEKSRDGGLMARDGRKVGFPDRKFVGEVAGLKVGDEINIEITGQNSAGSVFFWRWVKDIPKKELRVEWTNSEPIGVTVRIMEPDALGVNQCTQVALAKNQKEADELGIGESAEWQKFCREVKDLKGIAAKKAARLASDPVVIKWDDYYHKVYVRWSHQPPLEDEGQGLSLLFWKGDDLSGLNSKTKQMVLELLAGYAGMEVVEFRLSTTKNDYGAPEMIVVTADGAEHSLAHKTAQRIFPDEYKKLISEAGISFSEPVHGLGPWDDFDSEKNRLYPK